MGKRRMACWCARERSRNMVVPFCRVVYMSRVDGEVGLKLYNLIILAQDENTF